MIRLRIGGGITLVAALAACAGAQPEIVRPAEVEVTAEKPVPRVSQRQSTVQKLLAQADAAYDSGRYTQPEGDNAFDRYHAVLMLDPGNKKARAGLDALLLAYIDHVRSVMAAGQLSNAQDLLRRADTYFADAPLLQQVRDEIEQAKAAVNRQQEKVARADILDGEQILLPDLELSQRSAEVIELLASLAARVRDSQESVMIMARNDREGRWIYKIMQEATADHRIRGDIRISRIPAVVLMPPL